MEKQNIAADKIKQAFNDYFESMIKTYESANETLKEYGKDYTDGFISHDEMVRKATRAARNMDAIHQVIEIRRKANEIIDILSE